LSDICHWVSASLRPPQSDHKPAIASAACMSQTCNQRFTGRVDLSSLVSCERSHT